MSFLNRPTLEAFYVQVTAMKFKSFSAQTLADNFRFFIKIISVITSHPVVVYATCCKSVIKPQHARLLKEERKYFGHFFPKGKMASTFIERKKSNECCHIDCLKIF